MILLFHIHLISLPTQLISLFNRPQMIIIMGTSRMHLRTYDFEFFHIASVG